MPQMMPINWIMSFIMFIFIFILFNMMNYYIFYNKKTQNKKMNYCNNFKIFHWKW